MHSWYSLRFPHACSVSCQLSPNPSIFLTTLHPPYAPPTCVFNGYFSFFSRSLLKTTFLPWWLFPNRVTLNILERNYTNCLNTVPLICGPCAWVVLWELKHTNSLTVFSKYSTWKASNYTQWNISLELHSIWFWLEKNRPHISNFLVSDGKILLHSLKVILQLWPCLYWSIYARDCTLCAYGRIMIGNSCCAKEPLNFRLNSD